MSVTQRIAIAGAIALLAGAAGPESSAPIDATVVAANVHSIAVADAASAAGAAQSTRLTVAEMDAMRGDGWLKKLWKAVVKVVKWIIDHLPPPPQPCQMMPCDETVVSEQSVWDASVSGDVVDTYENTVTVNEYYDDPTAFNEGRISSSQQSESGFVYTGRTGGGGGGGGGGCDQAESCLQY